MTILQKNVLDKLLAIKDPRTDKRIDFVGGIRGLTELQRRVDRGEMKAAFSLYPVSIGQLFDIADSGEDHAPEEHLVRAQAAGGFADTSDLKRLRRFARIILVSLASKTRKA